MAMGENDALLNDQKEAIPNEGSSQNSPWKKPVEMPVESPVMGEKIWPALTDVQGAKTAETPSSVSQVMQNPDGLKKSNDVVTGNSSHKPWQPRYNRGRPKKGQNTGPPFPVPVVPRVAYPPPVPFLPPVRGHGNGYQPMPAPFPIANNCFGKPGSQIPMKPFSSPLPVMDDGQNFHPPAQRDQAVNPPKYSAERIRNTGEDGVRGDCTYLCCPRPWPFDPKGGFNMQEYMAPRAYMRPASVRPAPFIGGPPFPGPGHMRYRPTPPPIYIRAPFPHWISPHLVNPWACGPQPVPVLREAIVKQIEYYFSDENLLTDHYLLSQMDDQGWVPISVIADFKRLKRLCTDIGFILDALRWSSSVEVKGYKVRRKCDNTLKKAEKSPDNNVQNNLPSEDYKVDVSPYNNHTCDGSAENEQPETENSPFTDSSEDANSGTEETEALSCSAATVDKLPNVLSSGLTA
ncbi:hypothetical protein V2J09_000126 [Rumex salicifolius]